MICTNLPFEFKMFQFPVKTCFSMSINKYGLNIYKVSGMNLRSEYSNGQYCMWDFYGMVHKADQMILIADIGTQ